MRRSEFSDRLSKDEFRALHRAVDIARDSYPYTGGATTCETLWLGVPVVSLAGDVFRSRAGLSLLSTVGLPQFVAGRPAGYLGIAGDLAQDPVCLQGLRASLSETMRRSPLCDAPAYTRALEKITAASGANGACTGRRGRRSQESPTATVAGILCLDDGSGYRTHPVRAHRRSRIIPTRVAESLVAAADLPQRACASMRDWENTAVRLAQHPVELHSLRKTLAARERLPLFYTPRFVRDLECAFQAMWKRQLACRPLQAFAVDELPR